MTMTLAGSSNAKLDGGRHVCWVVGDDAGYRDVAAAFLADGAAAGRKTAVFGPLGSQALRELGPNCAVVADPRVAFLDGGPLNPAAMFSMFREQTATARAEGHTGLCLVADMDWLLPGRPGVDAIVDFELHLDRVVTELDAVVVCAYRSSSFDTDAIAGALSVHPVEFGDCATPQFRLVAGDDGGWHLAGEVDLAVERTFGAAFEAALTGSECVVDVTGLEFIDVAGMRVIAESARNHDRRVRLRGAPFVLRRSWAIAGFEKLAPQVDVIA